MARANNFPQAGLEKIDPMQEVVCGEIYDLL